MTNWKEEKEQDALMSKIDKLLSHCDSLKKENTNMRYELARKEESIKNFIFENERLKKEIENLKFAKTFSSAELDNEAGEETKKRLSQLVQEVDRCINILRS